WEYERPYLPLLLESVTIPDDLKYWLTAAQWIEVLGKPEGTWLPQVLTALQPLGVIPTAQPRAEHQLAGRERELGLLRDKLAAAKDGKGGLVLIGGEAGVGKTTLADAVLREAAGQGFAVLEGHCFDLAETPPYGPFIDLFARFQPSLSSPPLPNAFKERGTVGAVPSQMALFVQVQDFLTALSGQQPVAVLLDDLHWSDPASLDLLRFLARSIGGLPLLVFVTYRSDELTRRNRLYTLLPQLAREAGATRIDLGSLDDDAVRAVVSARYGLPDADTGRLVAYLQSRAEGNALFVGELLRAIEEGGVLARDGDTWHLGDLTATAVPALLRQVIDGRVGRLDDASQRLLAVAAAIGQEVPLAVWAAAGEADEAVLFDLTERAEEMRLLVVGSDGETVRFAHALIREALYEGIAPLRRARLHRSIADALLALPQPDPDTLVHHLRTARDQRLGHWLFAAGTRAFRASAQATAIARYEEALPLLAGPDDAMDRYVALYRLTILRVTGPAAVDDAEEAVRVAEEMGNEVLAACALSRLGFLRGFHRDISTGLAELERAAPVLAAHPDFIFRAALAPVNAADVVRGNLASALTAVGRSREAQTLVSGVALLPNGYLALIGSEGMLGHPEAARAAARAYVSALSTADINVGSAYAMDLNHAVVPYHADDVGEVRRLAAAAEALYERMGEETRGFAPRLVQVAPLILHGRWDEALIFLPYARRVRHLLQSNIWAVPLYEIVLRARGERALGWEMVGEMFPAGPGTEPGAMPLRYALAMQRLGAALALDEGGLATAKEWLEAHDRWLAWSGAVPGRSEGQTLWSQYYRQAGESDQAREHAERALAHATEPRQPLALLAAHRLL
ncbi:MAG: ATP-binding protein, partial [Thermomicrobiales bacterium]